MNARQRWLATMRYESADHWPDEEFGYCEETLQHWQKGGLPEYVGNANADEFFGFDYKRWAPIRTGVHPSFEYQVLEEHDDRRVVIDTDGCKCVVFSDGASSIPKYMKFPIESRADWNDFKKRLDPETPGRYPADWSALVEEYRKRDYVLGLEVGSLLGWIRNWMGFENFCYAVADDSAFIEEMVDYLANLELTVIAKALNEVEFDVAHFWEDIAFNKGPIVSPAFFKRVLAPHYERITQHLNAHGIEFISVDCDGNIDDLVPLWLDAGVNVMFPLEQNGGADPNKFRAEYGQRVLLSGGVDKTKLIAGGWAIDDELKRLEPLMRQGGFVPHLDHRCPPDVSYENYIYYIEKKREICGIPQKAVAGMRA